MILDDTAVQFATDWANIVLKSYVDDVLARTKAKQQANQPQSQPAAPPAPKSSIVLTDS